MPRCSHLRTASTGCRAQTKRLAWYPMVLAILHPLASSGESGAGRRTHCSFQPLECAAGRGPAVKPHVGSWSHPSSACASDREICVAQAPKSAMDIEREQEAKLAKKYGGLAKKKIMPKVASAPLSPPLDLNRMGPTRIIWCGHFIPRMPGFCKWQTPLTLSLSNVTPVGETCGFHLPSPSPPGCCTCSATHRIACHIGSLLALQICKPRS